MAKTINIAIIQVDNEIKYVAKCKMVSDSEYKQLLAKQLEKDTLDKEKIIALENRIALLEQEIKEIKGE